MTQNSDSNSWGKALKNTGPVVKDLAILSAKTFAITAVVLWAFAASLPVILAFAAGMGGLSFAAVTILSASEEKHRTAPMTDNNAPRWKDIARYSLREARNAIGFSAALSATTVLSFWMIGGGPATTIALITASLTLATSTGIAALYALGSLSEHPRYQMAALGLLVVGMFSTKAAVEHTIQTTSVKTQEHWTKRFAPHAAQVTPTAEHEYAFTKARLDQFRQRT